MRTKDVISYVVLLYMIIISSVAVHEMVHIYQFNLIGCSVQGLRIGNTLVTSNGKYDGYLSVGVVGEKGCRIPDRMQWEYDAFSIQIGYIMLIVTIWTASLLADIHYLKAEISNIQSA